VPVAGVPEAAVAPEAAPTGTAPTTTPGAASAPVAIRACTSGSSSRFFHMRLTTTAVTTMPMMHAGRVIARIWVSPRF
jgi:hypothetical protein